MSAAGKTYLVENLLWSGQKIKNSCSAALKEKLIKKTISWPVVWQTGVVYLKLIIDFIKASTPKSTRMLINKLQDLSVCNYDGENICLCCSTIKGAHEVLANKKAVPHNFVDLVFDVLERFSVEKFVTYMRGIKKNHKQKVKVVDLNYLLSETEQKFQDIDDWNGVKNEDSIFLVGGNGFWNYGAKDHYTRDCPHPKQNHSGRSSGGGGRSVCGRGRRCGGRGCGCGRRGGQGCGRSSLADYDCETDPFLNHPV